MIDTDQDGVINFKEFAITLGIICRGDLHERLKFIYRLHLPPALPLSELEENTNLEEDGEVDSCSEVDVAEEVDESDGIERYKDGTFLDPLGAGVVVIEGKVTRQSSTDSERSRRNLKTHPSDSENITSDGITKPVEDIPTNFTNVSDVGSNVSDGRTSNCEVLINVPESLTKGSDHSTKLHEGSATPSESSSEVWDGCSLESDNNGYDFIPDDEFVDIDYGVDRTNTKSQQGVYHVVEGSDVTDGVQRDKVGRYSETDGGDDENMNQVRTEVE